jgi:hypothetical protein
MDCVHFPESRTFRVIYRQKRFKPIGPDPLRRGLTEGWKYTERNKHRKDKRDTNKDTKRETEGRHNKERHGWHQ